MNKAVIARCAADPMAFYALAFQAMGCRMASFQQQRFAATAPALLATAKGEKPPQQKFFIECVKGTSKTSDMALMMLWLLTFARVPRLVQCGAGDFDQASEIKKAMAAWVRLLPWLSDRVEIRNWNAVCKATGVTLEILSADEQGTHGGRPDVLLIDELVHIKNWPFVETLADNATKVPHCLTIICTNSGFLNTPAYRWRELARQSPRWVHLAYNEPAPWVDPEEIAEAEARNSPQRFLRLWKGVWSSGTGDHIETDDIEGCIIHNGPLLRGAKDYRAVAGLDLGVKHDHSALVVLGVEPGIPRIRVLNVESWQPGKGRDVDLMAVERSCIDAAKRYNLQSLWFDPSQAHLLVQRLRRTKGIICQEMPFVGANLDRMALTLIEVFRNRSIELYRGGGGDRLLQDLGRIVIEEKPFGHKITAVSDASGHADVGTAFSIALVPAMQLLHNLGAGVWMNPGSVETGKISGRHGVHLHRPNSLRVVRGGVPFDRAGNNGWQRVEQPRFE